MKRVVLTFVVALALAAPAVAQPTPAPALAFVGLSLADAQAAAVAHSPDVGAATAVVRENQAALAAARGALGPALTSSYAVTPQAGPNGSTITSRITTVGVQTTLGDLVAYSPLVAAAAATVRSAQSGADAAARTERLKVVGQFFDALKARAVRGARESALASAIEQRRAAEVRFSAGDAPRLDVVRAEVAVAKATADAETARVADANATEALRIETGVAPGALVATAPAATPPARDLDPDAAVARALAQRPDLAQAERTTESARAAARAAHRGTLPAITVAGGYASGIDGGQKVSSPTLNLSLNLPLSGAAHARAQQADAVVDEDAAKAEAARRGIVVEVAAAARSLAAAQRASAASSDARRQADAQLAATQLGYRSGASSSLELTAARDVRTQALVDELSALYDEARARAVLALEVGGP